MKKIKSMQILIVTEYFYPHIGGVEIVFKHLGEGLVKKGHNVTLVTTRLKGTKKKEIINGVNIIRVWTPRILDRYFFSFLSIFRVLKESIKADIIHGTLYNATLPSFIASFVFRKKSILTVHEVYGKRWKDLFGLSFFSASLHTFLEKSLLKLRFDKYICVSHSTANDLKEYIHENKISVIYNGIDQSLFSSKIKKDLNIKKNLGLENKKIYLFYGRPGISKGAEYLVRAVPKIKKEINDSSLVMILNKRPEAGYQKIKELISNLRLKENIVLIDPVKRDELPKYLKLADCIVVPSLAEGFGFTAAESCNMEIPVVVTKAGSLPEVVSGKIALCDVKDSNSLAEGIINILNNKGENIPKKEFLWKDNINNHIKVYESIVPKRCSQNRIAMIIDAWDPIMGGAQVHVKEICEKLIKNHGIEIDLFVRSLKDFNNRKFIKNESLFEGKLNIIRVGPCTKFFNLFGRLSWLLTVTIAVLKRNKKEKYDLIHAHAFLSGIPGKIVSNIKKIPIVYTVHGTSIGLKKGGIQEFIEKWLVTSLKYNQEISVSESFLKFKNVNKDIKIIANGVDLEKFNAIKTERSDFLKILWVGRFDKIKGLDFLIKAVDKIKNRKFELHLVGEGVEKESLKKLVDTLDLNSKIKFRGRIEGGNLIKEYKTSNFFILPSLSEGQPLTLLEAWAAKLPVIATKVGDNEKFINQSGGGYTINPGNVKELSESIEKLLNNDDLTKLGENGYNWVRKNLDWNKTAKQIYVVYQNLTKNLVKR